MVRDRAAGPCMITFGTGGGETFRRRPSLEYAGKTHHCLVGTQSTNISKITVSNAAIRKPTHAFFVSPPGPCLLPPLGWRTPIRRLTATDIYSYFLLARTQLYQRQS